MWKRNLNSWRSAIGHLICGGLVGLVVGIASSAITERQDLLYALIGSVNVSVLIGFLVWLIRAANETSSLAASRRTQARRRASAGRNVEDSPTPFVTRLSKFTGCDETEVCQEGQAPRSNMQFWSIVDPPTWHGPKPASLIRHILERIPVSKASPFQFSLRTVLIVITLTGTVFAAMRIFGIEPLIASLAAALVFFLAGAYLGAVHARVVRAGEQDPMSPRVIASFRDEFDASLLMEELADNGIHANSVGGHTSGFRAEAPGEVHVVVRNEDLERAKEVLENFRLEKVDVDWSQVDTGRPEDT